MPPSRRRSHAGIYALPSLLGALFCAASSIAQSESFRAEVTLLEVTPVEIVEQRHHYSAGSPGWLGAVGKLRVPTSKYESGEYRAYVEDCSATLVAGSRLGPANTIITAWHCLEHYRDLSRDIHFTLIDLEGNRTQRKATLLAHGGGMHADWAIMRLQQSIPRSLAEPLQLMIEPINGASALSMAGFSKDTGLGRGGKQLTYDPSCTITGRAENALDTSCQAYKGASGGAVVQTSSAGKPFYCGVISAGDSAGVSRFMPVTRFRTQLASFMQDG